MSYYYKTNNFDLIKETNQHVANVVTDKIEIINAEITQKIDHIGSKIGNIIKVKNIFKNKEFFICDAKKNYSNGIIQLNNAKF